MSDLIDRQDAIDVAIEAADDWDGGYNKGRERIIREALEDLPSAEPEIIRCKDCKHWDTSWKSRVVEEGNYYCPMIDVVTNKEFFCSWAERRER